MADVTLDAAALEQLSQGQKALLDTIDSLRTIGVDKYVPLPQLIVVGDQSAGKSSVLEAISRVRFPTKGSVCTRFATELVLRTAPRVKIDVSIKKDPFGGQSESTTNRLQGFSETSFSKDALPGIIEEAKRVMGVKDGPGSFSEDILHVQIAGPDLPELTLVDLPGFYETGSAEQSEEGREIVDRIADKYMRQCNSIILAIISAKASLNAHKVLRKAKIHDPKRERTLGIVTKPDYIESGSEDEAKYIQTIRNKEPEHILKLGWHVLRNRGEHETDFSDDQRDARETELLQSGRWASISFKDKGIETLRKKLSKELVSHIQARLPDLIEEIEKNRAERHHRLMQLGRPRSTPDDLRMHLSGLARQYEKLATDAIEGTYRDPFFPDLYAGSNTFDDSDIRRLRATIRNMNRVFDAIMSHRGAAESITLDGEVTAVLSGELRLPEYLISVADMYQVDEPKSVTLSELKSKLEVEAAKNQGSEFPGSSNDDLALHLFKNQSSRWEEIARRHVELLVDVCRSFVESLFDHIASGDPHTRDAVVRDRVNPFFNQCSDVLKTKLEELLHHYKHGPAMPLEAEFLDKLGLKTKTRLADQVKNLLKPMLSQVKGEDIKDEMVDDAVRRAPETDVTKFGVERIIDIMAVYYEMSLRTFVENVIILAVENCLVQKIPTIFTTEDVIGMELDKLEALAAESMDIQEERKELNRDLSVLNEALEQCRIYRPRGQLGFRHSTATRLSREATPAATPEPLRSTASISPDAVLSDSINGLSLSTSSSPTLDPRGKRVATVVNGVASSAGSVEAPFSGLGSAWSSASNKSDANIAKGGSAYGSNIFTSTSSLAGPKFTFAEPTNQPVNTGTSLFPNHSSSSDVTPRGLFGAFGSQVTDGGNTPKAAFSFNSPISSSSATGLFGKSSSSTSTDVGKLRYIGMEHVPIESPGDMVYLTTGSAGNWPPNQPEAFNHIAAVSKYRNFSPEELRLRDYVDGSKLFQK